MPDAHDVVLGLHVAAGSAGLLLGAAGLRAEREPPHRSGAGTWYAAAVAAVALTALGLVARDPGALWWLVPLAVLSSGLALAGWLAPRRRGRGWARVYAHGQGGSYIALVTALLVVSLEGPASVAAWIVPTLVGLPLIERRMQRISQANPRMEVQPT